MTSTLPLSSVMRQLQEKVVTWDSAFVDFERHYLGPEREKRPIGQPLKRIFSEKERRDKSPEKEKGREEKEKPALRLGKPLPPSTPMAPPPLPTPASEAPSAALSIEAALGVKDPSGRRPSSIISVPPTEGTSALVPQPSPDLGLPEEADKEQLKMRKGKDGSEFRDNKDSKDLKDRDTGEKGSQGSKSEAKDPRGRKDATDKEASKDEKAGMPERKKKDSPSRKDLGGNDGFKKPAHKDDRIEAKTECRRSPRQENMEVLAPAAELGRITNSTPNSRTRDGNTDLDPRPDERRLRSVVSTGSILPSQQRASHLPSYVSKRPGHLNLTAMGAAAAARRPSRVGVPSGSPSPGNTKASPLRHRFSQVDDSSTDPEGKHVRGLVRHFDHAAPDSERRASTVSVKEGTLQGSSSNRRLRSSTRGDSDATDATEGRSGRRTGAGSSRRVPSQTPSRAGSPSRPHRPTNLRTSSYTRPGSDRSRTPAVRVVSGAQDRRRDSMVKVRSREGTLRRPVVPGAKVSTITRHYNRMSRDAEREQTRQRLILAARMRRVQPVAYAQAKVKVFDNVREALVVRDEDSSDESDASGQASLKTGADADADNEDELSSDSSDIEDTATAQETTGAPASGAVGPSSGGKPVEAEPTEAVADGPAPHSVDEKEQEAQQEGQSEFARSILPDRRGSAFSEGENAHQEKNSLLKALSGLWTMRSGAPAPQLEYPMAPTEHVFADSQVIVREEEPSSIIAFTLSCSNYQEKMRSLSGLGGDANSTPDVVRGVPRTDSPAPCAGQESQTAPDIVSLPTTAQLEAALRQPDGTHLRFEFESGSSRLWCRIFYAEQFEALRRSAGCEDSINESLSRCVPWDSAGGKSGAAFLKTGDDRLVVKQLSRYEMDAFSKFAPHYFQYMAACFYHDRPTTLAKIFGCFRFGFKNPQTGKSLKMDCVVLENLFYGKKVSNIWDLKGSTRNRHVQPTGRPSEVLQDENFLEMTSQNPLFVREHSKRTLQAALWNDSLFLADMNVMDYSLVVGLDSQRGELIVGMIDIVRTFTWDKRVESFVKEAGLLPRSGKGEPTVITPRQYRARFLSFLSRAFLLTPDPWLPPSWS